MENSNVTSGTQQTVVESASTDVNETSGTGTVTTDTGTNTDPAPRNQSKSENRSFAEMRRAKEASDASLSSLVAGLNRMGFEGGNPEEILEHLEAKNRNMTVQQLRADKQAQADAVKNDPTYKAMEQKLIEGRMKEDLAAIQSIDPSVQSLDELGEDFAKLIAAGVSATVAYNAVKTKTAPKPANLGPIGQSDNKDSEYFTSEQLDALTEKDLEDPKILAKAMASLAKL